MKYLEELEQKVLRIIHINKELKAQVEALHHEKEQIQTQEAHLETALLKEANTVHELTQDKEQIKSTIEELLGSISVLENDN